MDFTATISLRCRNCGAPLKPSKREEYVKCEYCGYVQRLVDAREYLEQLIGFVNQWLSSFIPPGYRVQTVDPLARHAIFIENLKPQLELEYLNLKVKALNILSHPLTLPPFIQASLNLGNSAEAFLTAVKINSIKDFATTQEDEEYLRVFQGLASYYGYVLNALKAAFSSLLEKYYLVVKNLQAAHEAVHDIQELKPLAQRTLAQKYYYEGLSFLVELQLEKARTLFRKALEESKKARKEILENVELSVMLTAIDLEREFIESVVKLAETLQEYGRLERAGIVTAIGKACQTIIDYGGKPFNLSKFSKIIFLCIQILKRKGSGNLEALPGEGTHLLPFWIGKITYTFKTGILWMKRGEVVEEEVLIPALIPNLATREAVEEAITDIFKGYESDIISYITGSEKRISGGEYIKKLLLNRVKLGREKHNLVLPLTSKEEAERILNLYLSEKKNRERKRIKLVVGEIVDQIYIPYRLNEKPIIAVPLPPNLQPKITLPVNKIKQFTIKI